jgi:hypothetical protein
MERPDDTNTALTRARIEDVGHRRFDMRLST